MQQWFNGLLTMDAQCWLIALAALSIGLLILVFVLVIRGKNDRESLTQALTLAQESLIQKVASDNKEATRQVLPAENTHLRMELNDRLNSLTNSLLVFIASQLCFHLVLRTHFSSPITINFGP